MAFRIAVGIMYTMIAAIFLAANSYILAGFAAKWAAHDQWSKWLSMAVAAAVPWGIALLPHILAAEARSYGKRAKLKIAGMWFAGLAFYVIFIGYNLIGGTGQVAYTRQEEADTRSSIVDDNQRLKHLLKTKTDALAAIPAHRPPDAVKPLIEAHTKHPFWARTQECRDVANRKQRDYCGELFKMQAEVANATSGEKLRAEIEKLTAELGKEGRRVSKGDDPQITFLATLTGWNREIIIFILLLSTPVILELGALYWINKALRLLGVHLVLDHVEIVPPSRRLAPPRSPSQMSHLLSAADGGQLQAHPSPLASLQGRLAGDAAQQFEVLESWWRDCTRHADGQSTAERRLYEDYRNFCAKRLSAPLLLEKFRELLADKVLATITVRDELYYSNVTLAQ